jgi:glycosyltransferase involved in cell wall biosynthesis
VIGREIEVPTPQMEEQVAIIMPVYNEVDTIERTIRELYDKLIDKMDNMDTWVFEDGSTDGTKDVLTRLMKELPNLHVRMAEEKKGYPRAMKEAFLAISPSKYEYVASLDSDGQYDPADFFKIWKIMQEDSPDIVMGRRVTRKEPVYRKFLSKGLQVLEKLMFPVPCKDVTSVLRLMRVEVAHEIARAMTYSKYNFWLEFTARMALSGHKVVETPVSYRERLGASKVYSVRKMPKVIISEFKALRAVKKEYKENHAIGKNFLIHGQ